MIPRTVLIAVEPFGEGPAGTAARAADAIGRGVTAGDPTLAVELCPIERTQEGDVRELLGALDFDRRMRAARAVVVGGAQLDERTLLGSATFEIATRARQAGVPAYAVTGKSDLSLFDARILDLQVILEAHDTRSLRRAGERLAGLV